MLHCNNKGAALQLFHVGVMTMAIAIRFRKQAARCAALARQTHDDEARQRYIRLEQTYLQMAEAEEKSAAAKDGPAAA